jgi:hypothetical protein
MRNKMRKKPIELYKNKEGYWDIYDDTYDITIHCESAQEMNDVIQDLKSRVPLEEIEKAYKSIRDVAEGGYVDIEEIKVHFSKWLGLSNGYCHMFEPQESEDK